MMDASLHEPAHAAPASKPTQELECRIVFEDEHHESIYPTPGKQRSTM